MTSDRQEIRAGRGSAPSIADPSPVTHHASPSFTTPLRIYWEDTDAGGIVYYANYLKFMERARTEWLRQLGVEQEPLRVEQGLIFVVVHADVQFKKPARYGDMLQVGCALKERSRVSMTFEQTVKREETAELLVAGVVKIACLDAMKMKPRGLPESVVQQLAGGIR